jgi:drug/metabolite transporter (DMT)-like permease
VTLSDDSSSSAASSVKGSSLAAAAIGAAASNSTSPVAPPAAGGGGSAPASHSVWGDMLCLVSAAFYACYTIVLRKALPDDDEANVALFFGYVGLLCSVAFAPVVALAAGGGALHLKTIPPKAYLIILVQGGWWLGGNTVRVQCVLACRHEPGEPVRGLL